MNTEPRNVLVTAGATGIGRAIADKFIDAGERVHVVDIDPDAIARLPDEFVATVLDVADEDAVAGLGRRDRRVHVGEGVPGADEEVGARGVRCEREQGGAGSDRVERAVRVHAGEDTPPRPAAGGSR